MKTFLILLFLSSFAFAQADWDYGDPSPSGYYTTMAVDNDEYGYLIGPDTYGWMVLRREGQTIAEFRSVLMRMVDALSSTSLQPLALKAKKKKKAH